MKIIHIVHGKANPTSNNGISRVVYYLNKYEKLTGIDSQIWAIVDGVKHHETYQRDEFVTVECYPRVRPLGSNEIIRAIEREQTDIDLIHFHLIWFYDKNIIMNAIQRLGIRSVVTTHGTYSKPHAYTGVRIAARYLYELKYLSMATECHILTPEEGTGLMRYGYKGRSFVVANGFDEIDLPKKHRTDFFKEQPFSGRIILTMVAVLREDKNIDRIITAISILPKDIRDKLAFVLIGPDYKNNATRYKKLAKKLNVEDCFYWIGPLYNDDKYNAMYSSDGYIMASDSEGFSMAIIDAMACGLPMILTSGCNMKYLSDEKFYIMCEPYAQDLSRAIIDFVELGEKRKELGEKARKLLESKLYWSEIVKEMIKNYHRIINNK